MPIFNVVADGKIIKRVEAATEVEAYAVADDLGMKGKVYDIVPDTMDISAKPVPTRQDASWVNTNFGPAQMPITESPEGTYNYVFTADGQNAGEYSFVNKPTDVQLKMFSREKGMPENARWKEIPMKYNQAKAGTTGNVFGDATISLFPRTANATARGEGAGTKALAGALDVASMPGRAIGWGLDKLSADETADYADVPSMYYTGGETETVPSTTGTAPAKRSFGGNIVQSIIRDPSNIAMLIPGVAASKAVTGGKAMLPEFLQGLRTVDEAATLGPGLDFTVKTPTTFGKVVNALEKPRAVPKYTTPIAEGATNIGTEFAKADVEDREVSPFAIGLGGGLPMALRAGATPIKEGAISSLTQDLKLKPKDLSKRFAPEVETLFKNKDIPIFGGTQGILENVSNKIKLLGEARTKYLQDLETAAKLQIKNTAEPYYGEEAFDVLHGNIAGLTADISNIRNSALEDVEKLYLEGSLEDDTYNALKEIINRKVDDLGRRNPLPKIQNELNRTLTDYAQQSLVNKYGLEDGKRIFEAAQAVTSGNAYIPAKFATSAPGSYIRANPLMSGKPVAAVPDDIAPAVDDFLTHFEQSTIDVSPFVPMSIASKRRSLWFDQGAVNNPKTASMTPDEKRAAEILWGKATQELAKNKRYADYSGQLRDYVPLENALEGRMPALENRNSVPLNPLEWIPAGARGIWRSNIGLRSRYGIGSNLEGNISPFRMLGTSTGENVGEQMDPTMDTEAKDVELSPNDRALLEALMKRKK